MTDHVKITKSSKTALTLMGDCLAPNLSLVELEVMLVKAYDSGYANAMDEVNKRIERNGKWLHEQR